MIMNVQGKKVAIIGGGRIALRKAKGLVGTGAHITVISPKILDEFQQLPLVTWKRKEFEPNDIKDMHLIFAATNVKSVNEHICQSANDFQWVNDVSESKNSSFITPAVVRKEEIILSISTSGTNPRLAKQLKQQLEKWDIGTGPSSQ